MVIYSSQAIIDLTNLLYGLRNWSKHHISDEHALSYVDDIADICDVIDLKAFHFNTQFPEHKRFGEKVHTYRRNKQTNWYIIYNLDSHGNVYIQRIFSNHLTTEI
ncbi:MAG: hypothetical protein ACOYM7_03260 [Paludibacter sp.]